MTARVAVALICVTHNSRGLLPDFADATRVALHNCDNQIVVVDSGSTDDTVAVVNVSLPEAEVCRLDGNRGFAAGINAGVAHVNERGGAEVLVVVNPDVRLGGKTVPLLVDALVQRGAGLAIPQLRDEHGDLLPSQRRRPSVTTTWCDALLGGPLAARLHLPSEVIRSVRHYTSDGTPAWATGGCMALSGTCFDVVGEWDESFFLYEEEVDFALRASDAGFALIYVSEAVATRIIGSEPVAPWAHALMRANRARLMAMRHGTPTAELMRGGLLVGEGLRSLVGRPEASAALWALWHRATPEMIMRRYHHHPRAQGMPTDRDLR